MGLGNPGNNEEYRAIFNECIENGYILLGKGGEVDWSDPRFDDDEEVKKADVDLPSARTGARTSQQ